LGILTGQTSYSVSALSDSKSKALEEMKKLAKTRGANAVVGLDIYIAELTGTGVLVSANATAVYIVPIGYKEIMKNKLELEIETKKIEEEKERKISETINELRKRSDGEERSALEQGLLKAIYKSGGTSAMGIMKMFPKSISPGEISSALQNLIDDGILSIDENGYYRVIDERTDMSLLFRS